LSGGGCRKGASRDQHPWSKRREGEETFAIDKDQSLGMEALATGGTRQRVPLRPGGRYWLEERKQWYRGKRKGGGRGDRLTTKKRGIGG
jgi:hypothetical protein